MGSTKSSNKGQPALAQARTAWLGPDDWARSRPMSNLRHAALIVAVTSLSALALAACRHSEKKSTNSAPDAGTAGDMNPLLNPKLRQAIAAASVSASAAAKAGDAPPPGGVFEPGAADAVHAPGAPLSIQLGTDGNEPRVGLTSGPAEIKGTATVTVETRVGPRAALPSVDLTFTFKSEKPKTDKPGEPATARAAIVAQVQRAVRSAEQPGQLPPQAIKEIGRLAGSEIRIVLASGGGAEDLTITPAKGALSDVKRILVGAADTLLASLVPPPPKPVGVGAAWVAQARHNFDGVDSVSYRLYHVKSIDGDKVTLSCDVREYAASSRVETDGLPSGSVLQQYDWANKGDLQLRVGEVLATRAKTEGHVVMMIRDPSTQPPRMLTMQLETAGALKRDVK